MTKSTFPIKIIKVQTEGTSEMQDHLAVEEPLEIQLEYGNTDNRQRKSIYITMRTPGADADLAAGFLFTEGIINSFSQIKKTEHTEQWSPDAKNNVILISLTDEVDIDFKKLERHFYTSSSCGVCGKSSIEAIKVNAFLKLPTDSSIFEAEKIHNFPTILRQSQSVFSETGGLHAAALFDNEGKLHLLREDVGRHNAVDKLIGAAIKEGLFPLHNFLIMVSGRASFELIQKSLMGGIPILAAVGAPSNLAVQLAEESGMTVLGFVRDGRLNIYSHSQRIKF